jgi:hypothetical protein
MDGNRTIFGDLRVKAVTIYRVQTESSVYVVAFHEERGRKYVVVRGQAGTDREHVVVRDSDPRIGEQSLFDVPPADWVGQPLEIATMKTSNVVSVHREGDPAPAPAHHSFKAPAPGGMGDTPRIVPVGARGTHVGNAKPAPHDLARQLVMGQADQAPPYPLRHVVYAEDVVTRLRSIHRREGLWHDLSHDRELRERLTRALEQATQLLAEIKQRTR